MATEIERKFLVASDAWRADAVASRVIVQGYFSGTPACSVRVRIADGHATLNIKGLTIGARRSEFEYPVPLTDARQMLQEFCAGRTVEKTRHLLDYAAMRWEIDVFSGANTGLVTAEIELEEESSAFARPPWLGDEVTDDPRYYNQCLAERPYESWPDE